MSPQETGRRLKGNPRIVRLRQFWVNDGWTLRGQESPRMNKKGLRNSVEWYPVQISGKIVAILQAAWNIVWWHRSIHNLDDNSKKCYLLIIFPLNYFLFLPEMKPGNHFQSEKIPSCISTNVSKRNLLVSRTIKSMQKVQTDAQNVLFVHYKRKALIKL